MVDATLLHSISHMHYVVVNVAYVVIQCHNEVHNAIGNLASLVWNHVKCETIVRKSDSASDTPAFIVDLAVWGVCMVASG